MTTGLMICNKAKAEICMSLSGKQDCMHAKPHIDDVSCVLAFCTIRHTVCCCIPYVAEPAFKGVKN